MSLNTVIAFALLLKKMTQKDSMKRKTTQQRLRKTTNNKKDTIPLSSEDDDKRTSLIVSTSSMKNTLLKASVIVDEEDVVIMDTEEKEDFIDELKLEQITIKAKENNNIIIRDFAYPIDSPLHFGRNSVLKNNQSTISLSSPDFTGRDARALFDFKPETEYEVELKAGQSIWVQYRQCPGWLIADVQDETGLIPESYVEFI
ncbi:uncharacterized protein BX663DRAFT_493988 [Cokeromyces recurvatus]|uniref:uncharacterized protein n=1 Tax=Cokeromyces recurvatus TaxID=90255 RepID=UPI0022210A42|nr:uncharacterized protein BX663DRAFT_493988 [Cokeromyces recurvatus]KAI7906846.1 hypothetical protein BX663DRAFT_493988 [Cokeromyces recurvatus]